MAASTPNKVVNVGLIGCGEVAQVVHIPTLSFMSDWFRITYLCDVSPSSLKHCASKLHKFPKTTDDAAQLCKSDQVDVVVVVSSDEYHATHAVLALEHDKHVLVEKPLALTKRDVLAIGEAEKRSKGSVMVGYMRRYAAPFEDAVREIGGMDKILYARVRDIIGPNSHFVNQSGTFPKRFADFTESDTADKNRKAEEMVETALKEECGNVPVTTESTLMWRLLGGLGSHDLSVMREALGMPEKVVGSSLGFPFWNVLYRYKNFTVSYESGIDNVPRFDAHLEVYSMDKTVRIQYDTPYVKGLPVTMHIVENADGIHKESTIRKSYEDPYTLEMKTLWDMVVQGKPPKTTVEDALHDLELFAMAMRHGYGHT
ncbi:NAD binding Rossmann fold oxidoreductase [Thelonectria olida]|uniref:NAD binding Rossmann fold oxidoreductase n=1 Tax=Thelonectria olida TaxID=1576542 RepID=A0A9P8VUZ2_9HYPO|nr:NAD binding Rossmann fold oxidoreductase [Thelonectria olida]